MKSVVRQMFAMCRRGQGRGRVVIAAMSVIGMAGIGVPAARAADGDAPAILAQVETIKGQQFQGNVSLDPRGYLVIEKVGTDFLSPVEFGEVKNARFLNAAKALKQGLMLTDDSLAAATVTAMDDKNVTYTTVAGEKKTIVRSRVARLQFGAVAKAEWDKVPPGKTGVLLTNGDFFEGTVTTLNDGSIGVESVLFGPAHFSTTTRAKAAILADGKEGVVDWEIWTSDGSILMADSAKVNGAQIDVSDPWLGDFHLALTDVQQIKAGEGRTRPLGELTPALVDPTGPYSYSANATPQGLALDLMDRQFKTGVYVSAGCSVTWNLAGQFRSFTAVPGVPLVSLPGASVRLIVLVDGQEKYRSEPLTSIDDIKDSRIINLDLSDAKSLTLRVEGDRPGEVGGGGAFCGASVQKR